ncbi:MAG: hypothetical protein QXZ11_03300 [Thermoproteota archaeon]
MRDEVLRVLKEKFVGGYMPNTNQIQDALNARFFDFNPITDEVLQQVFVYPVNLPGLEDVFRVVVVGPSPVETIIVQFVTKKEEEKYTIEVCAICGETEQEDGEFICGHERFKMVTRIQTKKIVEDVRDAAEDVFRAEVEFFKNKKPRVVAFFGEGGPMGMRVVFDDYRVSRDVVNPVLGSSVSDPRRLAAELGVPYYDTYQDYLATIRDKLETMKKEKKKSSPVVDIMASIPKWAAGAYVAELVVREEEDFDVFYTVYPIARSKYPSVKYPGVKKFNYYYKESWRPIASGPQFKELAGKAVIDGKIVPVKTLKKGEYIEVWEE